MSVPEFAREHLEDGRVMVWRGSTRNPADYQVGAARLTDEGVIAARVRVRENDDGVDAAEVSRDRLSGSEVARIIDNHDVSFPTQDDAWRAVETPDWFRTYDEMYRWPHQYLIRT